MTTYEKIVKGATKVKVAAPKSKYIEPILLATSASHGADYDNFGTIMRTLQHRLQDSAWSVVYKSLIVVHIMVREGDKDFTLRYIGEKMPNLLVVSQAQIARSSGMTNDVRLILKYAKYLQTRVKQFASTGIDYVRDERSNNSTDQTGGRLRFLSVEKGLLRECESVQKQIDALLRNNFMENDVNNDVVLTAFRLLVNDLLALFQELNEGVINLLEHYFEMSKVDAERALRIYKKFVDQTKYVIDYLRVAKHLEHLTKLHVPTIKHAPTALTSSLEEYLDDPNFETNRRQYLLERQTKKPSDPSNSRLGAAPAQQTAQQQQLNAYNPWEQQFQQGQFRNAIFTGMPQITDQQTHALPQQAQQAPMAQVQSQLQNVDQAQVSINPAFTGAGFGGYGAQLQMQPQHTNPFMQAMATGTQQALPNQYTQQFQQPVQQQPFQQPVQQQPVQQQPLQQQQPMTHQFTSQAALQRNNTNPFSSMTGNGSLANQGTGNPFANSRFAPGSTTTALTFNNGSAPQNTIQSNVTGSNPFKVSETATQLFNNAAQAKKAQQALRPQPTAGGLENLPTIPVFPETQQQQQRQQLLSNNNLLQQMQAQQLQAQQTQQFQAQQLQAQQTQQFQAQQLQAQQTQQWNQQQTQWPQQPVQPQQTQQWQQPAVQQPIYANNTYNGTSLI